MSKVIYTAILGNYDDLKDPRIITPGWRYICFTDSPALSSTVWEIIRIPLINQNPQLTARYYKLIHYQELGERTIWMDASFIINCNLDEFWNRHFKSPFTAPAHPIRNCVYREGEACIRNQRADEETVHKQLSEYRFIGIPTSNGMISSGILLRESISSVKEFCIQWWTEVSSKSLRDQIAFGRIDYEKPGLVKTFKWDYRENYDFLFTTHLNKRHITYRIRRKNYRARRLRNRNNNQ